MVILRDFEMPDSCLRCQFCIRDLKYPTCKIGKELGIINNTIWEKLDKIPEWCPIEERPDKISIGTLGYWFANLPYGDQSDAFEIIKKLAANNYLIKTGDGDLAADC